MPDASAPPLHPVPPRRLSGAPGAAGLGCAFFVGMLAWVLALGVGFGVGLVLVTAAFGLPLDASVATSIPAMATLTWLQLGGWAALAFALALANRAPLREVFALRSSRVAPLLAATFGALFVGLFPSWIAEQVAALLPAAFRNGTLDIIAEGLLEGGPIARVLLLSAVVVAAPIFEELIFRGFLWDTFRQALPEWAVWLLTSLLFAAIHVDPVQSVAVLWTGLFVGWLRWRSGSLLPCVVAHTVNNALAALATFAGAESDLSHTPLWLAALGVSLTLAFAALAALPARRMEP